MTSQLLSCLVIVLVIQFHTKQCQANPFKHDAVSYSQAFINEYSKADESTTALIKDGISQLKKINLEGIEEITKEDKNLYKDSLRQLINAKKELQYNHINLETYAESTIDTVDELSRLIYEIDSNPTYQIKGKIKYNAEKILSFIDISKKTMNRVRTRFLNVGSKLSKITSDMKDLERKMKSLKKNIEQEKDKFVQEFNSECGWWCKFKGKENKKENSLTLKINRMTIILEGFSFIPTVEETNNGVNKQLGLVNKLVQMLKMPMKDFVEEASIYNGVQGNKKDILSQLKTLKQACQYYINNGKKK